MAIQDDWSINSSTRLISYTGTTANYTTLEFHRFLQDYADNASETGDDELSIIRDNPSAVVPAAGIVTLLNGYTIDDIGARHLYQGSVSQLGGDTLYGGLSLIGSFTAEPVIYQNGAKLTGYWGTSYNPNPTTGVAIRILVKIRDGGTDIDGARLRVQTRNYGDQYREASTTAAVGVTPVALGNIANDPFNNTAIGTIAALTGITNTEGYQLLDIGDGNGGQPYYSQWDKGVNTLSQLYEWIKWATRDGTSETLYGLNGEVFRGVTHEINIDTPTGTFNAVEPVSWTGGTGQMLAINSTTAGTKMWIQLLTGVAPTDGQTITGGTSSATADVNVTVTTRALGVESVLGNYTGAWQGAFGAGFDPADLGASDTVIDLDGDTNTPPNNATYNLNGLVVGEDRILVGQRGYRFFYDTEVGGPFLVGETLTFTSPAGTAKLVGLYGAGTAKIMVVSEPFTGSVPQDNSTITGGTSLATANVSSDPVNAFDLGQLTLATSLTGASETSVVVSETIPSDTPATGTIRIMNDLDLSVLCTYTSFSGSTFTINTTDFSTTNATSGNRVAITYIDKLATSSTESFTGIYSADRTLYISVRDGGVTPIVPFETIGVFGFNGGSTNVIRQADI